METNTNVKFYMFNNTNAPELSNTWGCLIDILDACLVTGFGSIPVTSLNVDGGICTATFATSHNFKQHQVIEISGADRNEFNTEFRILSVPTANTFTFAVDTNAIGVEGSISCSLPSLGWKKEFSGMQKAVYRGNNGLDALFLRVDNSCSLGAPENGAKFGKVTVCDAMSGIDSFDGVQMPFDSSNPQKNHTFANNQHGWFKWYYATAQYSNLRNFVESSNPADGSRGWLIIGDTSSFLIFPILNPAIGTSFPYGFGKTSDLVTNFDNYFLLVSAVNSSVSATNWVQIIDPISGRRSDYRANACQFYDSFGAADYQQVQTFLMPLVSTSTGTANDIINAQYSGVENSLAPYSATSKYIGFDIIGVTQSLPSFKIPFLKSLAQRPSANWQIFDDGFMSILCNQQEADYKTGYLLNLTGY